VKRRTGDEAKTVAAGSQNPQQGKSDWTDVFLLGAGNRVFTGSRERETDLRWDPAQNPTAMKKRAGNRSSAQKQAVGGQKQIGVLHTEAETETARKNKSEQDLVWNSEHAGSKRKYQAADYWWAMNTTWEKGIRPARSALGCCEAGRQLGRTRHEAIFQRLSDLRH
jgi:hypothetical protein